MPVILKPDAWPLWLGEQPADPPQLKALLAPYPAEEMIAWPVGARVGSVKNNVLLAAVTPAATMDRHAVPDPQLTPGVIASADTGEVCASDGKPGSAYSRAHRSMNENARRADFERYGIAWPDRHRYEDDHLVPLCLGGADVQGNRWPEPRWGIWNSYEKDRLEGYACRTVCSGQLDLGAAQH